jgi:hypothetical protein
MATKSLPARRKAPSKLPGSPKVKSMPKPAQGLLGGVGPQGRAGFRVPTGLKMPKTPGTPKRGGW